MNAPLNAGFFVSRLDSDLLYYLHRLRQSTIAGAYAYLRSVRLSLNS